ncbi:lactate dehydrogenase [Pseudomonas syringae]|nr:lactate dehydrogenase [Pseudomonas syringae]
MSAIPNDQPVRTVSYQQLTDLLRRIFLAHGTSPEVADVLAENCASAQRDGSHSHGIFRMPGYISSLNSGWVDGKAVPLIEDVGAAFVRVDAGNGFAQPALAAASSLLIDKVRSAGIAVLAIRNSHHFAALWPDVEPFAEQGLVALSMVNSMTCVVPHGARQPLFGTNPIAFAAPRAGASLLFSTWQPAPLPMVMFRSQRGKGDCYQRVWAWTAMAGLLKILAPFSMAGHYCPLAVIRGPHCR